MQKAYLHTKKAKSVLRYGKESRRHVREGVGSSIQELPVHVEEVESCSLEILAIFLEGCLNGLIDSQPTQRGGN